MYDLYLAQYTHKYGNGYAIIGARNAEQVSSILRNQGRFRDAIIVACKKIELPAPPDGDMQLMIEGAVTTIGNSAYDIAVSLGYRGTKEEWLESMKGPKGDPGPTGSYIAGNGIDITDGVISVIESGSKISYAPDITEGTKLGTLNIDGRDYNIYSPTHIDAYTKDETNDLLDDKQDTLIAGDNITIVDNVISANGSGDSVWEKDANNNIFPKGNTNVTGKNCFVTGLTSKANHNNNISIGYNNESRGNNSIVIGVEAKDFDPSGDALGWFNLIAIGNNPVIPPKSLNTPYKTWQTPKFIVGGIYGFKRWNTLEQTVNGDLYIKGINGWDGTNATPDGTSHLQGYLNGLDTRITNNTTAIYGKQDTISAGDGIDVTNNVVSVDNTVAKKTDVYTKGETDSLLNNKQDTLTAGTGISITNNTVSCTVDISGKEDKAIEASFTNEITAADNTIFKATADVTTLNVIDAALTATYVIQFNTAATGTITVTLPQSIIFTDTPTFSNNEHWEIAVRRGYVVWTKYALS